MSTSDEMIELLLVDVEDADERKVDGATDDVVVEGDVAGFVGADDGCSVGRVGAELAAAIAVRRSRCVKQGRLDAMAYAKRCFATEEEKARCLAP